VKELEDCKVADGAREAELKALTAEVLDLKNQQSLKDKELGDLRQRHAEERETLKTELARLHSIFDTLKSSKEDAEKKAEGLVGEMEKLKGSHAAELSTAVQRTEGLVREIEKLKNDHATELNTAVQTHAAEVAKVKENHAAELSRLKKDHSLELVRIGAVQDVDLESIKNEGYNAAMEDAAKELDVLKDQVYRAGYEFGLKEAGFAPDHELFGRTVLCPAEIFALPSPPDSDIETDREGEKEDTDVRGAEDGAEGASSQVQVAAPSSGAPSAIGPSS